MTVTRKLRLLAVAACLLLAASRAQAQFPGDVPDNFRLNVGGMYAWFGTDVTLQEDFTPGGTRGAGDQPRGPRRGEVETRILRPRLLEPLGPFLHRLRLHRLRSQQLGFDCLRHPVRRCDLHRGGIAGYVQCRRHLPYLDLRYNFIKNDAVQFGLTLGVAYPILEASLSASAGVVGPGGPIMARP